MLQTLTSGLATVREPRMVRERFEEQLRALVRATSVSFRHDEDDTIRPNVVSFDLPGSPVEGRPRLEAVLTLRVLSLIRLPSTTARGRWRERGRMGRT